MKLIFSSAFVRHSPSSAVHAQERRKSSLSTSSRHLIHRSRAAAAYYPKAFPPRRDDAERIRSGEDRHISSLHEGDRAAAERADRSADLGVHSWNTPDSRRYTQGSREGPDDRADVGREGGS